MMQFFIAVCPPENFKQKVISFMKEYDPSYVNPHITVKAQSGLTPDKKWLKSIEDTCKSFPRFNISIGPPKYISDAAFLSGK
jgi:2'-5' RNA ligase